jgi:hypothetical protein
MMRNMSLALRRIQPLLQVVIDLAEFKNLSLVFLGKKIILVFEFLLCTNTCPFLFHIISPRKSIANDS